MPLRLLRSVIHWLQPAIGRLIAPARHRQPGQARCDCRPPSPSYPPAPEKISSRSGVIGLNYSLVDLIRAEGYLPRRGGVPMSDPLTPDDVLDAHDRLAKYDGDAIELFSEVTPRQFAEWQLVGLCSFHGRQTNTVTTDLGQEPSQEYVVCAGCLEGNRLTRLTPVLVIRLTEEA